MKKIVLTGPESTGKSTLAKQLATHFSIPYVKEHAREYINGLDRGYCQSDLIEIAKGQHHLEEQVRKESPNFLLCDTDLLTIKIWSEYKYNQCDKFIVDSLNQNLPDLYLFCYPDLPWKSDNQRENPNELLELFEIYKSQIEELDIEYNIIKGSNRFSAAVSLLNSALVGK